MSTPLCRCEYFIVNYGNLGCLFLFFSICYICFCNLCYSWVLSLEVTAMQKQNKSKYYSRIEIDKVTTQNPHVTHTILVFIFETPEVYSLKARVSAPLMVDLKD